MCQALERVYDEYGAVIYGVAMQISSSEEEAEQILMQVFKKLQGQKLMNQHLPCIRFVKLTIETALELYPEYNGSQLTWKPFYRSPLLKKLFCENVSIQSLSELDNITSAQCMKNLKMELSLFLNMKKTYLIRTVTIHV